MLANERKEKIIDLLKLQFRATLEELSAITEASLSTLRRDLNELEEEDKLRRIHGGAELLQDLSSELSVLEKSSKNVQAKEKIAELAIQKLQDGDIIFLDAGTTTEKFAELINLSNLHLTIVTNSISHLNLLTNERQIVYILGGRVKQETRAIIGSFALTQLSGYQFDIAFLGSNAYDSSIGAMTPDHEEAALKRLAIQRSKKSFILMDQSKMDQMSFVKFSDKDEAKVITEKGEL